MNRPVFLQGSPGLVHHIPDDRDRKSVTAHHDPNQRIGQQVSEIRLSECADHDFYLLRQLQYGNHNANENYSQYNSEQRPLCPQHKYRMIFAI